MESIPALASGSTGLQSATLLYMLYGHVEEGVGLAPKTFSSPNSLANYLSTLLIHLPSGTLIRIRTLFAGLEV